jgi:uncharacterized membrane protein
MLTKAIVATAVVALGLMASILPAQADSSDANCEVRKDGDKNKGASGPCTFSQRRGYVDLDLRNGNTFSLSPGDKANHYKDQHGNKVVRSMNGNEQVYKWENDKKIIVTFPPAYHQNASSHSSYRAGDTAPDLADLVGAKAGQAEGQLESRGYAYRSGSTSGDSKYSNWYNRSNGRCVTIRTEQGRYQSIVQAPPYDCGH